MPFSPELTDRVQSILDTAQKHAARSVNSAQVIANWLIGKEIVEAEQGGKATAAYGERIIPDLAHRLKEQNIKGYSATNLRLCRQFHLTYPDLLQGEISHVLRDQFALSSKTVDEAIHHALRDEFQAPEDQGATPSVQTTHRPASQGLFHPNLSWTHYRTLLKVESSPARSFYEIESLKNAWSARELERQINSLLFQRLAKSTDKEGILKLATQGHQPQAAADIFKDPVIMEFLGLPESEKLIESDLENALISEIQGFLLELGSGFAFVSRQQRLTLDGDHFYIDLAFYHTILKCHVLIDLKVGKLTHQDLGQLQLYVNYYDREKRTEGDNPTLGLGPVFKLAQSWQEPIFRGTRRPNGGWAEALSHSANAVPRKMEPVAKRFGPNRRSRRPPKPSDTRVARHWQPCAASTWDSNQQRANLKAGPNPLHRQKRHHGQIHARRRAADDIHQSLPVTSPQRRTTRRRTPTRAPRTRIISSRPLIPSIYTHHPVSPPCHGVTSWRRKCNDGGSPLSTSSLLILAS